MRSRSALRLLAFGVFVSLAVLFFASGGPEQLNFEAIKARQEQFAQFHAGYPWESALGFFLLYVAVTGISLPGATVLTLVGGAVFGLLAGTLLVSFASALGATLAFIGSRFVLRDWVRRRFDAQLRRIDEGVAREGSFYLFTLRLIPVVPFFLINLAMGLTKMRPWTFYWVSQLGMLAGTLVYVNAGTQLAAISSPAGIFSPPLLGALALLGLFPLAAKKGVDAARSARAYRGWKRPRKFDRNLIVIGAGSAGLVSAYIAAAVKAKVTLIEKERMGGDCLNTGCVPSKAFIKSARVLAQAKRARSYGFSAASVEFDFAQVMERVQRVIRTVAPHDSIERYAGLGVECLSGAARLVSPWEVECRLAGGEIRRLSARAVVIAAGARPLVPSIAGIEDVGYLTSDTVWDLRTLPKRLLVLGGGPIGAELAQAFARFGARVTLVETAPRLLMREDPEVSDLVRRRFEEEGITLLLGYKAKAFSKAGGEKKLIAEHAGPDAGREIEVPFDELLCAVGRLPNTQGYGLEELGIPLTPARTIATNEYLQTLFPNIYACGDVAGPYQFTHTAAHQAWYASVNALFGGLRKFRADYSVIPWATFTDPEIACVGLNETEARERGIEYETTLYDLGDLDRAIADEVAQGLVKVLTVPGKDRILGATIAGEHAADLIIEFVSAMRHGIGLNKILGTIHIYPTLVEANKYAAGEWKRAHAPRAALRLAERYHAWRRG